MSDGVAERQIKERLQGVDPYDFEDLVAEVFEADGWDAEVTRGSNDRGVDIEAWRGDGLAEQKWVIQAKRYSDDNKVGRPEIQQYHTLREQDPDADAVMVVTTSEFTGGAEEWADEHNVKLMEGLELASTIQEYGRHDLVNKYAPPLSEQQSQTSESETTPQPASSEPTTSDGASHEGYGSVIAILWFAQSLALLAAILPTFFPVLPAEVGAWIFVLTLFAVPTAVFADTIELHNQGVDSAPNRIVWPVVSFMIPVFGVMWYFGNRP